MKRVVRLEVFHCWGCPHSGPDINVTRTECKIASGRTIFFDGDPKEKWDAFIPDWCPLWNKQGKPMWKPEEKHES